MTISIRPQLRLLPLLNRARPLRTGRTTFPPLSSILRFASTATQLKGASSYPTPTHEPIAIAIDGAATQRTFGEIKGLIASETYRAITVNPFKHSEMTPVQAAVFDLLPSITEPPHHIDAAQPLRDLLVKAKTGTGKTLAFLVPAIENRLKVLEMVGERALAESGSKDQRIKRQAMETYARNNVGTLIISPTRELASQIANEALKLTSHHDRFNVCVFVGGESKGRQMREFNSRKDIIVATPGRLKDLIENTREMRPALRNVTTLVLDEADTLLDMGFRADIESIISELPQTPKRQTFLFSATVSPAIRQIARQSLAKNHAFIDTVSEDDSPVHAHVPQHYTVLPSSAEQLSHVTNLIAQDQLQHPGTSKVIVFLNTTKMTQMAASMLIKMKAQLPQPYTQILELHSKKDQNARTRISNLFRSDQSGASVLVTSDVSARGVDYPGVTRVIQVGAPASTEQYIHRVGRTGRGKLAQGRGDLVLLPFESSFPRFNLDAVPLVQAPAEDIEAELSALALQHDEQPEKFFTLQRPTRRPSPGERLRGPRPFPPDVQTRVGGIASAAALAAKDQAPERVEEAYAAMLGFYAGQKESLRASSSDILKGCKEWVINGMATEPPPISHALLQKMGLNERSKPSRGFARGSDRPRSNPSRGGYRKTWTDRSPARGTVHRRWDRAYPAGDAKA